MTTKTLSTLALTLLVLPILGSVVGAEEQPSKGEEKALFRRGAELWPQVCGTCHNARPGSERSPAEWDTIVMHMRSVANLPEGEAEAIKPFLKAR
jgi:mono/diheme cytochrome c family protein